MDHGVWVVALGIFAPVYQWTEKGVGDNNPAYADEQHQNIQPYYRCPHSLVASVLGFCLTSQLAFSIEALFSLEPGFESLLSPTSRFVLHC